jgi:hypothetical protein
LENQEYAETQLNTLMKEYKKNMNDKDVVFENRKASLFTAANAGNSTIIENEVNEANETVEKDTKDTTEELPVEASNNDPDTIEMTEVQKSIEQVDAWSSQKLGIQ